MMNKRQTRLIKAQKKAEPLRFREQKPVRQHEQAPVQSVTLQTANCYAQIKRKGLLSADLLALQRKVGNRFVQGLILRTPAPAAHPVIVQRDMDKQHYELSHAKIPVVKASDKAKLAAINEAPADYAAAILRNAGLKPDDWFNSFTTATFLGTAIGSPIHADLAAHLKAVETKLATKYGGPSSDFATARTALGLSTETMAGAREAPTSATFSMHLFGLAIDLNYKANPFISDSANDVFVRAGLLVNGAKAEFKNGLSYDQIKTLDTLLETYFSYIDNADALQAQLDVTTASPWKGMALKNAQARISKDLDRVAGLWDRSTPGQKATIKAGGFMDVSKELVEGMELAWGGYYGDMMHFDMRNKGNGAKIHAAAEAYKAQKKTEAAEAYKKTHAAAETGE